MQRIWCPETATKAYVDTVISCGQQCTKDSGAPEFISAMAGGWKAKLIVEARSNIGGADAGAAIGNSIGLAVAAHHSGGRHVCILANEKVRQEYISAILRSSSAGAASCQLTYSLPEVMVGEAEELMERLNGIDFLVVDGGDGWGGEDSCRVFSHAKFGHVGAVIVVCQNAAAAAGNNRRAALSGFRWNRVFLDSEESVVRSTFLPIGNGLDVAYVASWKSGPKVWIRHIDQQSLVVGR